MIVLRGLAILLLLQAGGEALTRAFAWPLPGPVLGMIALFLLLNVAAVRTPVAAAADALLSHLSLLFIPVGVGVILHLDLLAEHGFALAWVIVLSTAFGIAVTALTLKLLMPKGVASKVDPLG